MSQITTAKIVEYDGCNMLIIPQEPISREMIRKQVKNVELRLCDGRECTSEQRRKIFAIIGEIADWSGGSPKPSPMPLLTESRLMSLPRPT